MPGVTVLKRIVYNAFSLYASFLGFGLSNIVYYSDFAEI